MNSDEPRTYTIVINKKLYQFNCTDGPEHVERMKIKLEKALAILSEKESSQILSNAAFKLALLLADDAVHSEMSANKKFDIIEEQLGPSISDLDQALENIE